MISGILFSDPFLIGPLAFVFFLCGMCMGSFASAISYRSCHGESFIFGKNKGQPARSRCPRCGHTLGLLDLIPFFSWMFLGGRCRYCHEKVSVFYPLLEIGAGVILAAYFVWGAGALSGAPFALVKTLLFAVLLPFAIALIAALLKGEAICPRFLWIMGLLSCSGMVVLCMV